MPMELTVVVFLLIVRSWILASRYWIWRCEGRLGPTQCLYQVYSTSP